jgi:hypothetical protein
MSSFSDFTLIFGIRINILKIYVIHMPMLTVKHCCFPIVATVGSPCMHRSYHPYFDDGGNTSFSYLA